MLAFNWHLQNTTGCHSFNLTTYWQLSLCRCSAIRRMRRLRLKYDGTRAETRFRLLAKRTSPFKSAGASVHSTTGSRGVHISSNNARYTMFRGSVKGSGYPLHSPVSPSLPLPCVTVCHYISTGLYLTGYQSKQVPSTRFFKSWRIQPTSEMSQAISIHTIEVHRKFLRDVIGSLWEI